ncbi:heme peroxidase [Mytilinidion resinicola]|uniref:Peroxidase n=1 Tax=Mytilinidion resinicola TaxID=574789 RepID=A0A6A6Z100_9PEZI|nr:heme peroxidase [Mytilinidion resinicola]KAF2813835.1 heme peroxidase [Mytilinidion resinicola]
MKLSCIVLGCGMVALLDPVYGWPGMGKTMSDLARRIAQDTNDDGDATPVLIADLKNGITSPVGQSIANILPRQEDAQAVSPPGVLSSKACKADTCCVWYYVSAALTAAFKGPTGRCNEIARQAIRLGFHDAGIWSQSNAAAGQDFGGADGSILLSCSEISRPENSGLQGIAALAKATTKSFGVGYADLIQFSAIHAVVTCPLGPRIRVFVGRKDSSTPAPNGLLPGVNDSADKLVALFQDKTIPPHDLAALVGAHTTSRQFFVDTTRKGAPQDGIPGIWDTLIYNQTVGTGPLPKQVLRFNSDLVLSVDPRLNDEWLKLEAQVDKPTGMRTTPQPTLA